MKNLSLTAISLVLLCAGTAYAGDGETLAKNNNCLTCHAIDGKNLGPSFKDVAAKYKGDKNAQAKMEKKVRSGGGGIWGSMPMPATAQSVSDGDIATIVKWVLSL